MKATLHDELMREAGFETDYHRELEQRRRGRRRAAAEVGWLLIVVAALIQLWAGFLPGIPRLLVAAVVAVGFLLQAGDFVKNRLLPWMEDQI